MSAVSAIQPVCGVSASAASRDAENGARSWKMSREWSVLRSGGMAGGGDALRSTKNGGGDEGAAGGGVGGSGGGSAGSGDGGGGGGDGGGGGGASGTS